MKKNFFNLILTHDEIEADIEKYKQLRASGQIQEKSIPEYWSKGESNKSWMLNLIFSIFLGFFGVDRFYLNKPVSAVIKIFLICVCLPLSIWGLVRFSSTNDINVQVIVFVFPPLFLLAAGGLYFGDIIISIVSPRDGQFRKVKK